MKDLREMTPEEFQLIRSIVTYSPDLWRPEARDWTEQLDEIGPAVFGPRLPHQPYHNYALEMYQQCQRQPGIWTPWAKIYCPNCHTPPNARRSLEPRERASEINDIGVPWQEVAGTCDECGTSVWLPDEVGLPQQVLQAVLAKMGDNATGGMEQTGGMCCAASIAPKDRDYTVCITAMDEGIFIGMYRAETDDNCDPDDWREIGEIGTTVTDNDGDDVLIADESHVPEATKRVVDYIETHPTFDSRDTTMSPVITTVSA